jgi:hypothetical protein
MTNSSSTILLFPANIEFIPSDTHCVFSDEIMYRNLKCYHIMPDKSSILKCFLENKRGQLKLSERPLLSLCN